jgi:hypothetical protein
VEGDQGVAISGPLLLLFWDGVGLAPSGSLNPWSTARTPALAGLLGGPLTSERGERSTAGLTALDATLGVPGLPQSATGQTALFTGVNAPVEMGRHVAAFPGPRLRAILEERSVFRALAAAGRRVTFANPFPRSYWGALERGERRASATTCAVRAAGVRFRDLDDLAAGRAVTWDITGESLGALGVERVAAETAGHRLATIAADHDLTLHESFLADLAGHRRMGIEPVESIERLDAFLGGVLAGRSRDLTVLVTSDHGNSEEGGHRRHTRNPVPLLAVGPLAPAFADAASLLDVAPIIRSLR